MNKKSCLFIEKDEFRKLIRGKKRKKQWKERLELEPLIRMVHVINKLNKFTTDKNGQFLPIK